MMDPSIKNLLPGDPKLIESIVSQLKSQGIFDEFRRDCLADVDTKPAYQNLQHRVENFASEFLKSTQWRPDLNKNQLRDGLRRHINESGMLTTGVDRIIDQIVNPKIIQIFFPKITEIVRKIFGIDTSPSVDSGCNSEQALAFLKPVAVETDNTNGPSETKTVSIKQEPLEAAAPDVPQCAIDKPESSSYIDAIEEQLLVLTGAHEYMKLEQLHSNPISEPVCTTSSTTTKERIPNAERDKEAKRDKGKEDSNRKPDGAVKTIKKIDHKTVSKGKSSNSDKPRLNSSEKKSDKPIKRENSPTKSVSGGKSSDSKSSKPDDKKVNKLPPSEKSKSKSDLPRHEENLQKAKKLSDSKEGVDPSSKTQKPLVKSKSFDEKDGGKTKHEKSAKTDKARDEPERPKLSLSTDKFDKSKDSGKPRVSESDRSSKHRNEKTKSPDKKSDSSGNKHKSSLDESRHRHDEKSKSHDKKHHTGSHSKSRESEKSKPKSTKSLAFGDKLCDADKRASVSKPKSPTKLSSPSSKDDKMKSKKDLGKTKPDQKSKSSTSVSLSSTQPEKAGIKKPFQEALTVGNKGETTVKDGNTSNKAQKRQSTGSPDTSVTPKKVKLEDVRPSIKTIKNSEASPPEQQSSTSDSYSSSDYEEFKEFNVEDVLSPTKIREDILKKAGAAGDDGLSDVTVSSVHTSDLSDFDDRITLSESEEERTQNISPRKKSRSLPSSQEEPKASKNHPSEQSPRVPAAIKEKSKEETKEIVKCVEKIAQKAPNQVAEAEPPEKHEHEVEPRRELRRQRKLNPRYASDDFSSFFNTGKDKLNHGHIFEHTSEEPHHEMPEIQGRGRRSTGHSTTTDETEFPSSPISDVSEFNEVVKAKRGGMSKLCSPSESSDGDHSCKGPRSISSEVNEGEDFRPRTSSQHSTSERKVKQERHNPSAIGARSSPVELIVSPKSDSNGRRSSKAEHVSESPVVPKRTPARYDNQRYSSTDLYKPRPVFTSSRRRGTSPSKALPPCDDFGPLIIDESVGQEASATRERSVRQYTESQQSSQGKRQMPEKKSSSMPKRRR